MFDNIATLTNDTAERVNDAGQRTTRLLKLVGDVEEARLTHETLKDLSRIHGFRPQEKVSQTISNHPATIQCTPCSTSILSFMSTPTTP